MGLYGEQCNRIRGAQTQGEDESYTGPAGWYSGGKTARDSPPRPQPRPGDYARRNRRRFIEELKEFARFPSVSGQPQHAPDVRRCAHWLANHLRGIGLKQVKVVRTAGHPLVYAQWLGAPGRPTVLIYGHYDVQPPEPLNAWKTPPFQPTVRGEDLFGRGVCDDKGQLFTHIKALESFFKTVGALPVNIKCLFEGEEETGSAHLHPFVARNRRALAADAAVMSDTRMLGPDVPALTYSMRGHLALELELQGPVRDIHSGNYGGAVCNPIEQLASVLCRLRGADGRIAIPGFYDRVRVWSANEREYMAANGPSDARILRDAQGVRGEGEAGYSLYERTTIRPAMTVNGISGGYEGPGNKGIIPAGAHSKISFRLVPDQNPRDIERLFRRYLAQIMPPGACYTIRVNLRSHPVVLNRRHPALHAAATAYRRGFGKSPVLVRSGGTIPVVHTFLHVLGIPTALMGFALPDDGMHGPNEKFHLPNFDKGIATCLHFLTEMGALECGRVWKRDDY